MTAASILTIHVQLQRQGAHGNMLAATGRKHRRPLCGFISMVHLPFGDHAMLMRNEIAPYWKLKESEGARSDDCYDRSSRAKRWLWHYELKIGLLPHGNVNSNITGGVAYLRWIPPDIWWRPSGAKQLWIRWRHRYGSGLPRINMAEVTPRRGIRSGARNFGFNNRRCAAPMWMFLLGA